MAHEEQVDLYFVLSYLFEVLYVVHLAAKVDKDFLRYCLGVIDKVIAWSLCRAYRRTVETSSFQSRATGLAQRFYFIFNWRVWILCLFHVRLQVQIFWLTALKTAA